MNSLTYPKKQPIMQQNIPYMQSQSITFNRKATGNVVVKHQSPPAARIVNLPMSSPRSIDYLKHLMPQSQLPVGIVPQRIPNAYNNGPQCWKTVEPMRQFIANPSEIQDQRSNRSNSEVHKNENVISAQQVFTSTARSKGFSDFNPRIESTIRGKSFAHQTDYQQIQSPKQIQNGQYHMSQNKASFSAISDKKSNRSSSQHNIHITIESNIQGQPAPTITISPNQQSKIEPRLQRIDSGHFANQRIVNFQPPPFISRPTSISQTIISQQGPQINHPAPFVVNQPPTIINHHHPILYQPHPPQMNMISAAHKQVQNENTLASYSPSVIPANPNILSSQTLKRDKISSLSTGEFNRHSKSKKLSIETAPRHEYYNETIEKEENDSSLSDDENRTTGFAALIRDQKYFMNSRRLIDQIFENETHRALLQMKELQSMSRQKLIEKRGHSRSEKKNKY